MSAGPQTDALLLSLFEASYKRENEQDEAVWRSLPFFAAILAIAVAVLPTIYRHAIADGGSVYLIPAYVLLAASLVCFLIATRWFWQVIRVREYRYPPADTHILAYSRLLEKYHGAKGIGEEQCDAVVRDELRQFMIEELSSSNAHNRINNMARAAARSQVLLFVMVGFALAFFAEATILAALALGVR